MCGTLIIAQPNAALRGHRGTVSAASEVAFGWQSNLMPSSLEQGTTG
ncbi:MAG: hypothetical protein IMHGJWDQ_000835 [Candidatus Fervidibacter sp.]